MYASVHCTNRWWQEQSTTQCQVSCTPSQLPTKNQVLCRCLVFTWAYLSKATGGNCDRTTITTTMCFSPFTPYPGNLPAHKLKPAKHSNRLHRRAQWSKSTKCVPCVPLAKPQSTTGKTKTGNARYCCQRCACMQNGSIKIQQQKKMSNKAVNRQK